MSLTIPRWIFQPLVWTASRLHRFAFVWGLLTIALVGLFYRQDDLVDRVGDAAFTAMAVVLTAPWSMLLVLFVRVRMGKLTVHTSATLPEGLNVTKRVLVRLLVNVIVAAMLSFAGIWLIYRMRLQDTIWAVPAMLLVIVVGMTTVSRWLPRLRRTKSN